MGHLLCRYAGEGSATRPKDAAPTPSCETEKKTERWGTRQEEYDITGKTPINAVWNSLPAGVPLAQRVVATALIAYTQRP